MTVDHSNKQTAQIVINYTVLATKVVRLMMQVINCVSYFVWDINKEM